VRVEALSLERQDRVHEVLERLRAGERSVLRDVADQEDRDAGGLRERQQAPRAGAHLRDRARRRGRVRRGDRLNRVHDDRAERSRLHRLEDRLERRLGKEKQARRRG